MSKLFVQDSSGDKSRNEGKKNSIDFEINLNEDRRRLKGIHSRSDTNRTGAEGLSFYYPRLCTA